MEDDEYELAREADEVERERAMTELERSDFDARDSAIAENLRRSRAMVEARFRL